MDKKVKQPAGLFLDANIYSPEAVKLAAYVCLDRGDFKIASSAGGALVNVPGEDPVLLGEFANEALNQQCRMDLARVNGKISEMVVMKALLSAQGEQVKHRAGKK